MVRTVFLFIGFWIFMLYTVFMLIPYFFLLIPGLRKLSPHLVYFMQHTWSSYCIWLTGSKVEVVGRENLPKDNVYCVVSNHQGFADIPVLMSIVPWTLGFIAKKELKSFPILSVWMSAVGCIFLDRKDRRHAVKVMEQGVQNIRAGQPMAIFPEGTRSRGGAVGVFKPGSLKLAINAEVPIVPFSIDGTAHIFEANKGRIVPALVKVTIHPPLIPEKIRSMETRELALYLREQIVTAVSEN